MVEFQLLLGIGIGFWLLLGEFGKKSTISLDTDWVYRKPPVPVFKAVLLYFQTPFLISSSWGGGRPSATGAADSTYDENRFRQPIGETVFRIVVFFASIAL